MKIYADPSHYVKEHRHHLNNISKSHWNDRSWEEREQIYGAWVRWYKHVPGIEDSDIVLLTMDWSFYVEQNRIHQAQAEIENAARHGKKCVFSSAIAANLRTHRLCCSNHRDIVQRRGWPIIRVTPFF